MFFTDADTVHEPTSISSCLNCLEANKLDALSAYPRQHMKTFWEKMILTFINFGLMSLFPIFLLKISKKLNIGIGLGALMFYRSDVYRAVGGHLNIKGKCLEDIRMSKLVLSSGYRYSIFDGQNILACRMYKRFEDAEKGFRRFIYSLFHKGYELSLLFFCMIFAIFMAPFAFLLLLFSAELSGALFIIATAAASFHLCMIISMRSYMVFRFNWKIVDIIVYPASMFALILLSIRLIADKKSKKEINWKGRKYCLQEN